MFGLFKKKKNTKADIIQYAIVRRKSDKVDGIIVNLGEREFQVNYDDGSTEFLDYEHDGDINSIKILKK